MSSSQHYFMKSLLLQVDKSPHRLLLTNLSIRCDDSHIKLALSVSVAPKSMSIMYDSNWVGFALLTFHSPSDVTQAYALLHKTSIFGRMLK